jgi:2-iminobutanoate/2-iminopropanoate deaminase
MTRLVSVTREEIRVPDFCEPISHYVDAVRFGNLVFVSGIAAIATDGSVFAPDDVTAQTRHVFESLRKLLRHVGADFVDVLKVTVFLTDVQDRAAVNIVRKQYFSQSRPASSLIGVNNLALPGLRIEIEAVVGIENAGVQVSVDRLGS